MERRKLTKEDIDKVRDIEGFPIGKDEDIIALSDAPYYTACPNPFIKEFIEENGTPYDEETDDYNREPFASDVVEGKNDPIYTAHSYHTKVPYKAVMRYILHYTKPGDLVLDGFCGTGMTGVAAQMCAGKDAVTKYQIEHDHEKIEWGTRKAILCDLSPVATFIAANYNLNANSHRLIGMAQNLIKSCKEKYNNIYSTNHVDDYGKPVIGLSGKKIKGTIIYTVWSDVFICPNCGEELVYWDLAIDWESGTEHKVIKCLHCQRETNKNNMEKAKETILDPITQDLQEIPKQKPVQISYVVDGHRYKKIPDEDDLQIIKEQYNFSGISKRTLRTMKMVYGFNTNQPLKSHNVQYTHQLYTLRNFKAIALVYDEIMKSGENKLLTLITSVANRNAMRCNRFVVNKYNPNGRINGPKQLTLYIPSLTVEQNIFDLIGYKLKDLSNMYNYNFDFGNCIITNQSTTNLNQIKDNCIDYIFTDPPFGSNINYSELNSVNEVWLGVLTNSKNEAIVNSFTNKTEPDYLRLMTSCFKEYYRVLKPNRWISVEFHNKNNSIWSIIQVALQQSGFIVSNVTILDKKRANLAQLVNKSAVEKDLVITAYKPTNIFEKDILKASGTKETAWLFVEEYLSKLPVAPDADKNRKIDIVAERQKQLLFDNMVAWHIIKGIPVPMDAQEFYRGLDEHFLKRDDMYFLPEQVTEYDQKRAIMSIDTTEFTFLAITDEKNAIQWLNYQLQTPQSYAELQPKYLQELHQDKNEDIPELQTLLDDNFLCDDIGKWFIPDVADAEHKAKLREKSLMKEFEGYLSGKGKLKVFRSEAIRLGVGKLWKEKNYKGIVDICKRLPEKTIQEDQSILMYYDNSLMRI